MHAGSLLPYRSRSVLAAGVGLCLAAATLFAQGTAPKPTKPAAGAPAAHVAPAQAADGRRVYTTTCGACHQPAGEGTEAYPPLAGSEWVTGDEGRLARVILHGLTGDIEVAGTMYAGVMPGWGVMFKDEEIAAVMTYIRSSWGNSAPAVRAETVARVRQESAGRTAPWTAAELAAVKTP